MTDLYVPVKELPELLRACLHAVGFAKQDANVTAKETVTPNASPSGQGLRSFFALVNLATGECQLTQGSWGGTNMFTQTVADDMHEAVPLLPNMAAVFGYTGHRINAYIVLHPSNVAALLPASPDLTPRQRWILGCYKSLTSAGRKNEFARRKHGPSQSELAELAAGGYLKINKAGAVSITTRGKNVAGRYLDYVAPEGA